MGHNFSVVFQLLKKKLDDVYATIVWSSKIYFPLLRDEYKMISLMVYCLMLSETDLAVSDNQISVIVADRVGLEK